MRKKFMKNVRGNARRVVLISTMIAIALNLAMTRVLTGRARIDSLTISYISIAFIVGRLVYEGFFNEG